MRSHSPKVLALLASAALSACAGPRAASRPPPPEPALARVNGEAITAKELRTEFGSSHEGHSRFLVAGEPEARAFLEKLVDKRLLLQEARRMGILERADVRAVVAEAEAAEAARHLVTVELDEPAKPTDDEVQAAYDGAIELVDVRELRADTREQAERALARLRAGEEFDAVAREVSTAPNRVYGGLAKAIGWGARPPEWERVAFATPTGATSEVFETREGFELLRVEERHPMKKPELSAVAPKIRAGLEGRKRVELERRLRAALFAKYAVAFAEAPAPEVLVRVAGAVDAGEADPDAELAVASWSGGKLTLAELGAVVKAEALAKLPPERYRRTVRDIVAKNAQERLVREEAKARGYARVPAVAEVVAAKRDKVAVDVVLGEYVMKGFSLTEEDARRVYDTQGEKFSTEEERDVAHVEVRTLEEAQAVKALLDAGTPFEEVVKSHSQNERTKAAGGALGFVLRSDSPADFAEVFTVSEGETTQPIAGKGGYHVVKVRRIIPSRPRPWEQVKDEVLAALKRKRLDDALGAWTKRLRAASRIEYDPAAMTAFVKASEKEAEALGGGMKPVPKDHGGFAGGGSHGAGPHGAGGPHGGGANPHGGGSPHGGPAGPHGGGARGPSPHGGGIPGSAGGAP